MNKKQIAQMRAQMKIELLEEIHQELRASMDIRNFDPTKMPIGPKEDLEILERWGMLEPTQSNSEVGGFIKAGD